MNRHKQIVQFSNFGKHSHTASLDIDACKSIQPMQSFLKRFKHTERNAKLSAKEVCFFDTVFNVNEELIIVKYTARSGESTERRHLIKAALYTIQDLVKVLNAEVNFFFNYPKIPI